MFWLWNLRIYEIHVLVREFVRVYHGMSSTNVFINATCKPIVRNYLFGVCFLKTLTSWIGFFLLVDYMVVHAE